MTARTALLSNELFSLEVESDGQVHLPASVRESLGVEPGDLLSLTRNAISVRLDPYKDLLEDLQRSVKEPGNWRFLEQFLRRTLASVGADGGVAIPPGFLTLRAGDRFVLEVVAEGFRHALYAYRADG
jgi:bifunctional DNA-binding transcriptional regulator/antitoxin component of YhaV-PrlF toxin-antitoxin module